MSAAVPDYQGVIESLTLDADGWGRLRLTDGEGIEFLWRARAGAREIRGTDPPEFELYDDTGAAVTIDGVDDDELQERLQDSWYGIPAYLRNGRGAP